MNKLKIFKIIITSLNFALCVVAMVLSILYGTTKIGAYTYAATGCFLLVAVLCVTLLIVERKFGKNTFDAYENEEKDKNKEKKD